jgi:hypothetical protein
VCSYMYVILISRKHVLSISGDTKLPNSLVVSSGGIL